MTKSFPQIGSQAGTECLLEERNSLTITDEIRPLLCLFMYVCICINPQLPRQQRQLLDFEGCLLFSNNA